MCKSTLTVGTPNQDEVSYDSKQAAAYLHCTPRTLYELRRSGEIQAYALLDKRKRKTWRYLKRELDRYRERHSYPKAG